MLEKIMILHEMKLMGIDISVQLEKMYSKRLWVYSSIIAFFPHPLGLARFNSGVRIFQKNRRR